MALNRHRDKLLTWALVALLIAGFALVGSSPDERSVLATAGTALALFAAIMLTARGVRHWRTNRGRPRRSDPTQELIVEIQELTGRVATLEQQLHRAETEHSAQLRQIQDMLTASREMIRGDDGREVVELRPSRRR